MLKDAWLGLTVALQLNQLPNPASLCLSLVSENNKQLGLSLL